MTPPRKPPDPPPAKPEERTPSNGWDLLDDYQVGKDIASSDGLATRRLSRASEGGGSDEDSTASGRDKDRRRETTTRTRLGLSFWRRDGSAEQDAEVMARIMAREQARNDEATVAIARAKAATEAERSELQRLEAKRERQRREIEEHLALVQARRGPPPNETPLQRTLREMGDIFLALGICPDHLEWLPDVQRFCSWGGKLYDHTQVFALRDNRGQPIYTLGDSPRGPTTVCYSPRERRWHLDRAVPPTDQLAPVERLLPVPRRHADGSLRFSAKRAETVIMEEGEVTVYLVRNSVYTVSHLQAAHHLAGGSSPLTEVIADRALAARQKTESLARDSAKAIDGIAESVTERIGGKLGTVADAVTDAISRTTRLFRRK